MSERRGSYLGVILFAIVLGVLAVLQLRHANLAEGIVSVAAILFCLGLLVRQRWALAGVCVTLLSGIVVYFAQAWLQPLVYEDAALIVPNVLKMVVAILLFWYIGRERVEMSLFSKH
ncbi:MAG: hypothetical protein KatS3mg131_1520 [Candidatus Tectimicrobiota bacterium]|nr:MAG: hypothetical protein KatS3mg131_1520 [Candidatus Tectomicrobia bacterium]